MPFANKAVGRAYKKAYHIRYYPVRRKGILKQNRKYRTALKKDVLTHYSPNQLLRCSWRNCKIKDIDCLSVDHVNNDGAKQPLSIRSGYALYLHLRKQNFPDGYQTLCYNHQMKKEITRAKTA